MLKQIESEPRTVKLKTGTAVIKPFKGRDVIKAQRIAGSDAEKYIPVLISITTEIDGQALTIEDVEDLHGPDYLLLMGEFGSAFE